MQKETQARIKINGLLQRFGWRFFDDKNGEANITLEKIQDLIEVIPPVGIEQMCGSDQEVIDLFKNPPKIDW